MSLPLHLGCASSCVPCVSLSLRRCGRNRTKAGVSCALPLAATLSTFCTICFWCRGGGRSGRNVRAALKLAGQWLCSANTDRRDGDVVCCSSAPHTAYALPRLSLWRLSIRPEDACQRSDASCGRACWRFFSILRRLTCGGAQRRLLKRISGRRVLPLLQSARGRRRGRSSPPWAGTAAAAGKTGAATAFAPSGGRTLSAAYLLLLCWAVWYGLDCAGERQCAAGYPYAFCSLLRAAVGWIFSSTVCNALSSHLSLYRACCGRPGF